MPTSKPSTPKFSFTTHQARQDTSGGFFCLCFDDKPVCQYNYWAFYSCACATLEGFKFYYYHKMNGRNISNFEMLEEHHKELFEWLKTNAPTGSYNAKELLMCLAPNQVNSMPQLLSHPYVKLVDQWKNKAHGESIMKLYRISLQQDFR